MTLRDEPGTLARLAGALGDAGVNIEAIAGNSRAGTSHVQLVCNAPARAMASLEANAIAYRPREVIVVIGANAADVAAREPVTRLARQAREVLQSRKTSMSKPSG